MTNSCILTIWQFSPFSRHVLKDPGHYSASQTVAMLQRLHQPNIVCEKSQNVSTPPTITYGCSTHFWFFKPSLHNAHVQNVPFGTNLSLGLSSPSNTAWKASRRFWQVPAPANHSFSYNHLPLPFLHKAGRESHPSAHYCVLILGSIIQL